jgi:gluconolactonase
VTIPKFAAMEAKKLRDAREGDTARQQRPKRIERVRDFVDALDTIPREDRAAAEWARRPGGGKTVRFEVEPGVRLEAELEPGDANGPLVVLLNLEGVAATRKGEMYARFRAANARVLTLDLRATGKLALGTERVGRAPDHNSAQWGLWLGRPLLGQWVLDVRTLLRALAAEGEVKRNGAVLVGEGPAGLVALLASATNDAELVRAVAAVNTLGTLETDAPYTGQRLGVVVPGFLRDLGDVAQLASMANVDRIVIAGAVNPRGEPLAAEQVKREFDLPSWAAWRDGFADRRVLTSPHNLLKELGLVNADTKEEPVFEPGAKLQKLAGDGAAGEGPAFDPELGVLTSGAKGIHQFTPKGESKVWREKAGTNGLLFDRDGTLVCCEPVARSVSRISRDGKRTVLTDSFGGKKYNQPNDLTIDSKGRIYFSDPRYGPRDDMQQKDADGKTIEGVYRIDTDGKVSRIIGREVDRANGVLVSADDKFLFVADNNNDKGGARKLWRFDLKADGTVDLKSQKLLYDWKLGRGPDGLKQDVNGKLYVAGGLNKPNPPAEPAEDVRGGVYVLDPDSGKLLAFLAVPTDEVTNCAFGGDDRKTLYITGGGTLYSIRTATAGRVLWPVGNPRK